MDTENTIKKAEKVKPVDNVVIYGTDKAKNLVTGKAYKVHKALADTLIAAGKATKTKPKGEDKK